jgi:hypothetical protein
MENETVTYMKNKNSKKEESMGNKETNENWGSHRGENVDVALWVIRPCGPNAFSNVNKLNTK